MSEKKSIYTNDKHKQTLLELYDEKLESLNLEYEDVYAETTFGQTHILAVGNKNLPPIVVLHGINAGAGLALEPIKGLAEKYRIYGIDTIGQAGKSDETRLSVKDESYGKWLAEVLDALKLEKTPVIGVSYGSFILQKLISHQPTRIAKAIFVVPIIFAHGAFFRSIFKLLLPMRKFLKTKKEDDLLKFMDAFYTTKDDFSIRLQNSTLLGVKMDMQRPPLIKSADTQDFKAPVYILVAEDDIFAPAEKTLKKASQVFENLVETKILKDSKHVPSAAQHNEIEKTIERWLENRK